MSDLVGETPGTDYVVCDHCSWRGHSRWTPQRDANELRAHMEEEHPEKLPDPEEIPQRGDRP